MVEALTEEGVSHMRRFPGIGFRGDDAAIAENRRPLDELVELYPFLGVPRPAPDDGVDDAPGSM